MLFLSKRKKLKRIICFFFVINLFFEIVSPTIAFALTSGPSQEEFASFEPSSTSDMVDLYTGDFNYNIPLLSVPGPNGGYPINVAYHSGIGMEQEASWVGLGWNLNVGSVNRQLRGLPDDFAGDKIKRRQHMKESWMVALDINNKTYKEQFGFPSGGSGAFNSHIQVYYNNYKGLGYRYSANFTYPNKGEGENASIGLNASFDSQNGMDIEPKLSINAAFGSSGFKAGFDAGFTYNSRQGIQKFNFATNASYQYNGTTSHDYGVAGKDENGNDVTNKATSVDGIGGGGMGSSNFSYATNFNVPTTTMPMKSTTVPFNLKIAKPSDMGMPFNFKAKFPLLWSGYVNTTKMVNNGYSEFQAYGYLNHYTGSSTNLMKDFQRDNIPYSKKVPNLPTSSFSYDLFTQTGQGTGSMFRAFQNQIAILSDAEVESKENSYDGELEFGVGPGNTNPPNLTNLHIGLAFHYGTGSNRTGSWTQIKSNPDEAPVITSLKSSVGGSNSLYEQSYFKVYGEKTGFASKSSEDQLFSYANDDAIRLEIEKEKNDNGFLNRHYKVNDKLIKLEGTSQVANLTTNNNRNSNRREVRSTNIESFTNAQASVFGYSRNLAYTVGSSTVNKFPTSRPSHHISELSMLQADGMRYVYGLPTYNNKQVDNVFSQKNTSLFLHNINTNTVAVIPGTVEGIDIKGSYEEFMSRNEMPEYTNGYLLTHIYSADYVDLTNDGPTNDDYGYWVKFNYTKIHNDYKWRAPYKGASFIEGYRGDSNDDKASYSYGEKEIYYLNSIETKTHLAKFITSDRMDGVEAANELDGGFGTKKLKKLDKIVLFSKKNLTTPIKTVNFVYGYDLCPNVLNNNLQPDFTNNYYDENGNFFPSSTNINTGGKLTLKQIYFTYQNSTKSQLSPYIFKYGPNPAYERRNMDRWGNYNDNTIKYPVSGNKYPYIDNPYTPQDPQYYASGGGSLVAGQWTLNQIILPTGGTMKINYEFDDYYYVENQKACRMFDITGIGTNLKTVRNVGTAQFSNTEDHKIYFKLEKPYNATNLTAATAQFRKEYIDKLPKGQVYFKVLADIISKASGTPTYYGQDYVSGYADINVSGCGVESSVGSSTNFDYGFIELQKVPKSKLNIGGNLISPITRAIIEHLRVNRSEVLHNAVPYSTNVFSQITNVLSSFITSMNDIQSAVTGFNSWVYGFYNKNFPVELRGNSIIRLCDPDNKIGGGIRVKSLELEDNWTNGVNNDNSKYGQAYDYTTTDPEGNIISSGVAYEPRIGEEESSLKTAIKYTNSSLLSSDYHTFVETPVGGIHYPGESVGYSKVTVRSIGASENFAATSNVVNGNAAPITQYEFYTPKDFPVIVKQTDMGPYSKPIFIPIPILGLFTKVKRRQAKSQGYTVILNDMAGKPKSINVYTAKNYTSGSNFISEPDKIISSQKFIYNTVKPYNPNATNELLNKVQTITVDGSYNTVYNTSILGQTHDMYVDMNENSQEHSSFGATANIDMSFYTTPPYVVPIPWILPSYYETTNNMRTVVFNKIIHRTGILTKTETTSDKSTIVTENLAFDIESGNPILTKVTNEFKDPIYSFSFPGHWYYSNLGPAYKNFGFKKVGGITNSNLNGVIPFTNATSYFTKGDWVYISASSGSGLYHVFTLGPNTLHCVNSLGNYFPGGVTINSIEVVRSGYKNQQNVKVGNIAFQRFKNTTGTGYTPDFVQYDPNDPTTEKNTPMSITLDDPTQNKILNAGAIELTDNWQMACGLSYTTLGAPTVSCSATNGVLIDFLTFLKNLNSASNLLAHNLLVVTNGAPTGFVSNSQMPVTMNNGFPSLVYSNYQYLQWFVNSVTVGPPYTSTGKNVYYSGYISPVTNDLIILFSNGIIPISGNDPNALCSISGANTLNTAGVSLSPFIAFKAPTGCNIGNPNVFWTNFLNATINTVTQLTPGVIGGLVGCNDYALSANVSPCGASSFTMTCRPPCRSSYNGPLNYAPCGSCFNITGCYTIPTVVNNNCGTIPASNKIVNPYQIGMKGIWRTKYSYAYKTNRKQADNIREDGTYISFKRFPWENPTSKDPNWIKSNTVTKYIPEGFEVENVNPIGNFSSALYGYENSLTTALANNARYNDIGFDGFEDYPKACDQDHFSYSKFSANVTSNAAHTGKYSIKVPVSSSVNAIRETFINCDANTVNGVPLVNDNPSSINTVGGQSVSHIVKPCDCIGKFAPQPGKKYIFSAWVKQEMTSNPNGIIPTTYNGVKGQVTLFNGTSVAGSFSFLPSGNIIDGWQRIMGEFTVPAGSTSISVDLSFFLNIVNVNTYFDDVRVQPFDANMKTFVYDNQTLKVLAELDENNYATIYNYDDEGHLTKIKRETEEGIKTVQEGRINSKKVKN